MNKPSGSPCQGSESQILALIQLLSDRDERIVKTIEDQLITVGGPAVPYLEQSRLDNPELADRITQIIQDIHFRDVEQALHPLMGKSEAEFDLEEGAWLLARTAYPTLNIQAYRTQLHEMAAEVRSRIPSGLSHRDALMILNRYFFDEQQFRGNAAQYYDPENSFLNRVLDRRLGLPISLSVIYLLIGQRVALPVVGVGMPGHFVVGFEPDHIFVDCFNGGAILTQADCERRLRDSGYGFEPHFLRTTPPHMILERMIRNLMAIYHHRQQNQDVARLSRLIAIVEGGHRS